MLRTVAAHPLGVERVLARPWSRARAAREALRERPPVALEPAPFARAQSAIVAARPIASLASQCRFMTLGAELDPLDPELSQNS